MAKELKEKQIKDSTDKERPIQVSGYIRKDGTYVRPHGRKKPSNFWWNR